MFAAHTPDKMLENRDVIVEPVRRSLVGGKLGRSPLGQVRLVQSSVERSFLGVLEFFFLAFFGRKSCSMNKLLVSNRLPPTIVPTNVRFQHRERKKKEYFQSNWKSHYSYRLTRPEKSSGIIACRLERDC